MKSIKALYVLLLLLVGCIIGQAQLQVSGHVFDINSQSMLEGANVYLPELRSGVVSNHQGLFTIEIPTNGITKVQFSHIGYQTILREIDAHNLEDTLLVALKPISIQSEEVVISGISAATQHDNAIRIELLKAKDIETSGSPNLMEAIAALPGVNIISKSPGVSMPTIRGMSMTNIIVMNNGVKLENYQYSKNHAFIIDEFGVEQIEVIKGPASLLYGSGAVGGIINFIKEKPAASEGIVGDYTGHYHSCTQGLCNSLGLKGKNKQLTYSLRAGYKNHADYLDGDGDFVPNTRFTDKSIDFNIGFTKPYGSFNLYYDYNRPQLGMCLKQAIPYIKERGRKLEWWYQDLTSHVLSLRHKLMLRNYKFDVNIALQVNKRLGQTDTTTAAYKLVDATLKTLSYEVKAYLPSNNSLKYSIGFQGESKTNQNHDAPLMVIPDCDNNSLSVFALVEGQLWNKLKLQTGIRYDYSTLSTTTRKQLDEINRTFNNLSSSFATSYKFTSHLHGRISVASAYRIPNMGELTQDGWHGTRYEQGNAALAAQQNLETDLGLHYHSHQLICDIAAFYNHIDDYIYMAPTSDVTSSGSTIYRHAQCNANLHGCEISLAYAPTENLDFQASYSHLNAKKKMALTYRLSHLINSRFLLS